MIKIAEMVFLFGLMFVLAAACKDTDDGWFSGGYGGRSDAGEANGDSDSDTDGDADGDTDGDSDSDTDGDSDSDTDGDSDSDTDGDADGDSDGDADGDADSDGDGDGDSDADTDSDADGDGDYVGSCSRDLNDVFTCTEYYSDRENSFEESCDAASGDWSDSDHCPSSGLVGTCTREDSFVGTTIEFKYGDYNSEEIAFLAQTCEASNGVWSGGGGGGGDADADADSDSDSDADAPTAPDCAGGKLETFANLCWQYPYPDTDYTWQEAMDYCDNLTLAGHSDWRLPIRGTYLRILGMCDSFVSGGGAGYCNDCEHSTKCTALSGSCADHFWTSTSNDYFSDFAWTARFDDGYFQTWDKTYSGKARCVRNGP
ncbi:MAG: DUF1566 domain-containing protein [Deltaproteobacteria bacterium]|nr:DUF1566 domain-containing protein [Deltaproteobacteria bacterium]